LLGFFSEGRSSTNDGCLRKLGVILLQLGQHLAPHPLRRKVEVERG